VAQQEQERSDQARADLDAQIHEADRIDPDTDTAS
jgi:hypothetical protein